MKKLLFFLSLLGLLAIFVSAVRIMEDQSLMSLRNI